MTDRDAVRRGYDALAETYAERRTDDDDPELELLETVLEPLGESARVLDAGCGQGSPVLQRLAAAVEDAVGLDFSREQLRLAAGNVPEAALVAGDLTALPLRSDSFDAAVAYHSLIHVPLDDHRTVLAELARVLRPGGRLLVSEGTGAWTGTNPDWLDTGVEMQWDVAGAEATREHLRDAGFAVTGEWTVGDSLEDDDGTWRFFAARLDG